jgi:hypothetical protein
MFLYCFVCNILTWGATPTQTPPISWPPASLSIGLLKYCWKYDNRYADPAPRCQQHANRCSIRGSTSMLTDGWPDGRSVGQTAGRTDGRSDGRTVRQTEGRTDGRTERRTDGWTGGRTASRTASTRLKCEVSLESFRAPPPLRRKGPHDTFVMTFLENFWITIFLIPSTQILPKWFRNTPVIGRGSSAINAKSHTNSMKSSH